ncbi:hypothetical protein BGZ76_008393 [Entomortierella beljakovae]|nr:hypothetical protein BGZ76_008393 [Entomortierella beljakovae]
MPKHTARSHNELVCQTQTQGSTGVLSEKLDSGNPQAQPRSYAVTDNSPTKLNILVQDSEEEEEPRTDDTFRLESIFKDRGESLELTCISSSFNIAEYRASQFTKTARVNSQDKAKNIQHISLTVKNQVFDSDDEEQLSQSLSLDGQDQASSYRRAEKPPSSTSLTSSVFEVHKLLPTLDTREAPTVNTQSLLQIGPREGQESNETLNNPNESNPNNTQQRLSLVKSYPLRERTFQQRKPYTADKQQHARLIGSRSVFAQRLHSHEHQLGQDDDDEDSDYEDHGTTITNDKNESSLDPSQSTDMLPWSNTYQMDIFHHDLDDDGLPSIADLRKQFQVHDNKLPARKIKDKLVSTSTVKLLPALSSRAKRKLERLALHELELLEPIDVIPKDITSTVSSHLNNKDETDYISLEALSPIAMSTSISNSADSDIQRISDTENTYNQSTAKKSKRIRQHVLPMAFFKRNLLPDDAITLRSMRSKSNMLDGGESGAHHELDAAKLAHHAKRRLAPLRQGDSLGDFMARLGEDRSESESESELQGGSSTTSDHQDLCDLLDNSSLSGRPMAIDTVPFTKDSWSQDGFPSATSRRLISSDTDQTDLTSGESEEDNPMNHIPNISSFRTSKGKVSLTRSERLDMIDRMTVRTFNPKTRKRHSFRPTSRKRRRLSENSTYTRAIKPMSGNYEKLSNFDDFPPERLESRSWSIDQVSEASDESQDSFQRAGYINEAEEGVPHRHKGSWEYEDGGYDSNEEFLQHRHGADPTNSSKRGSFRIEKNPKCPIRQYGTNVVRKAPRPLYRPRVVPISRKPKLNQTSPAIRRSTQIQPKKRNPKKLLQRTLLPHLSSQSAHNRPNQPQHVNRPTFKAYSNITQPHGLPFQEENIIHRDSVDKLIDKSIISTATIETYDWVDQIEPTEVEHTVSKDSMTQPANPIDRARIAIGLDSVGLADSMAPVVISNATLPNGLYFSRETYVGRGVLSQLLRAMSSDTGSDIESPGIVSNACFFDQPFVTNWEDVTCIEHDLNRIVSDWKQRLQLTRESIRSTTYRGAYNSLAELSSSLLILENFTTLLAERVTVSHLKFATLWSIFKTVVLWPLQELLEELQQDQTSVTSSFLLWTRWFIATWSILASCVLQDEIDLTDRLIQSLLEYLLKSSGTKFLSHFYRITNPTQAPRSAIHGQDVLELWVCLIQVLNKHSELQSRADNFWRSFNRQVINFWLQGGCDHVVVEPRVDGDTDIIMDLEEKASHILKLLREICKIHQFEKDGSSNPAVQVGDNWELVLLVLQRTWSDELSSADTKTEALFREYLTFCHSRVYYWGWSPSAEIVVRFYRYFANRKFRDMPTEHGYRLPEFLKRLIIAQYQVQAGFGDAEHLQSVGIELNETPFRTVDRHDRCFEIFLKILAKTIHWQVSTIDSRSEGYGGPSATNVITHNESIGISSSSQAAPYQLLSKSDKIKACKKLLSSISPVIITKISPASPSEQTYSSICNPCNLVLVVAYFVPDFIRPSTVGQLRSLLNFEESDDLSRRILLESVFYLGISWQHQNLKNQGNTRSLDTVLEYIFDRIEYMCHELEHEMKNNSDYVSRNRRRNPIAATIETTLNYVNRLMNSVSTMNQSQVSIPSISFLDQRLSRFFNPEIEYLPDLRLQALGVIERFLALRKAYFWKSEKLSTIQSHSLLPEMSTNTMPERDQDTNAIDDGFSSLDDYDLLLLDESDFLDLSQNSDFTAIHPGEPSKIPLGEFCAGPNHSKQDVELAKVIAAWIYPNIVSLIKARHQALLDEQNQQGRSTIPSNLAQSSILFSSSFETSLGNQKKDSSRDNFTPARSSIAALSQQGIRSILSVFADCTVILHDQGFNRMEEITEIFKREVWLSPWALHWRQHDELVWATCVLESSPTMFVKNEELFLNIWFRTIGVPIHELTVQHRYLLAILVALDTGTPSSYHSQNMNGLISCSMFKDLPIAYRDYQSIYAESLHQVHNDVNVESTLKIASKEADLFQEFKESRLQLLAKVLGNIGEHYSTLRPNISSNDRTKFHQAQSVKSRYQGYLNLFLNQIKKDYERLELGRMVRESIRHAEMVHHIVGYLIQHCGLVMQNSQHISHSDSILNYFTSSRHFPQPKMDGVFIHQKIRGYAYLYQAGEKQFFHEMFGLFLNHLKLIPGTGSHKYDWPWEFCNQPALNSSLKGSHTKIKDEESSYGLLEVRVTDYGMTIYDHNDREGALGTVSSTKQPIEPILNKSHLNNRTPSGTIPRLFSMQSDQSSHSKGELESTSTLGSVAAQNQKSSIQSHFSNQIAVQKSSSYRSKEALRTLTSSLRNVALEAENRKECLNHVVAMPDQQSGNIRPAVLSLPLRPSLMAISVPTIQWLVSLIIALVADINDLGSQSTVVSSNIGQGTRGIQDRGQLVMALEGLQKETSTLFLPLLQCLVGCFDSISMRWLGLVKVRLGEINLIEEDADQVADENRVSVKAFYLFGQTLQAIETIARLARKMQVEHRCFYEQNISWREALMELIQFTLDHSFFLMEALGGSICREGEIVGNSGTSDQNISTNQPYVDFMNRLESDQEAAADRVSEAQDILSMEASFKEFLSGYTQFTQFEKQAFRELHNLSSLETWSGDVLSPNNDGARASAGAKQQSQPNRQWAEKLPRNLWVLWTFQSCFFEFCRSVSALDGRFHRQVQREVGKLLKPPSLTFRDSNFVQSKPERESIWYWILHHTAEPSTRDFQGQPWTILRWCMSHEWKLFLMERGGAGTPDNSSCDSFDVSEPSHSPDIFFV